MLTLNKVVTKHHNITSFTLDHLFTKFTTVYSINKGCSTHCYFILVSSILLLNKLYICNAAREI